jgi:hypothetical protein
MARKSTSGAKTRSTGDPAYKTIKLKDCARLEGSSVYAQLLEGLVIITSYPKATDGTSARKPRR